MPDIIELHLFSFAFGQCSITIRRQIRQFVIERNTSINSTTDCPISKTDWTLVIVNWTLCTTFGISKSFGQWAVSFITLVRMWEVCTLSNRLEWMPNCFEDMPFFTHNVEVMLNDELKPNFAELLRTSANLSAPTAGWGAEFCSCVESVLAIGHLQLQKGVLSVSREPNGRAHTRRPTGSLIALSSHVTH